MTLIFWQNIISPHQLPYIKELSTIGSDIDVILVIEKRMDSHRSQMGWQVQYVQKSNNFKIVVSPSDVEINTLFTSYPKAQHFFSGIRGNAMVYKAFKISLNHEVKRYLIAEGPFLYRFSKTAHYIKTLLKDFKYYKNISKVFAIGSHALNWYPKFNFKQNQVIPFSYVVEKPTDEKGVMPIGPVKFLFVGGLIDRKGVDLLLDVLLNINKEFSLDIIGDGDQKVILETFCSNNNLKNVQFIGTKSNDEIRNLYQNYDVHILPSRHDGWGAVINEALMAGLFVLCSDACGASELIHTKFNGIVFSHKKKDDLYNALLYSITHVDEIRDKKNKIKDWSTCIEGASIAKYFITALSSTTEITPPWKKF